MPDMNRQRRLRDEISVVGVGETDYSHDYARARAGHQDTDGYGLAARALSRALRDAGLGKHEIDGLVAGPALAGERLGEVLGLDVRWADTGDAVNAVVKAATAIHAGLAETVAIVYGNDQRTAGTAYGGPQAMGGERHLSYVYFSPWGLTSQGGLYALLANRYIGEGRLTARELAHVAVGQRKHAGAANEALMRKPLTVEDYLAAPYICEPLRLFDYCLINDGGVALILTTSERATSLAAASTTSLPGGPVTLSGVGRSDLNRDATSLRPRLEEFYKPAQERAAAQVYESAGIGPEDIDVLQVYDSFSIHVPLALEGFGFCRDGEAGAFLASGATAPGGRLPTNTSGGHLSGSYMQGWGHIVECVRQLRGQAGRAQVDGARTAQYISDVAGKVASLVFTKEMAP